MISVILILINILTPLLRMYTIRIVLIQLNSLIFLPTIKRITRGTHIGANVVVYWKAVIRTGSSYTRRLVSFQLEQNLSFQSRVSIGGSVFLPQFSNISKGKQETELIHGAVWATVG